MMRTREDTNPNSHINRHSQRYRGFTLVELLVAIAVIAVLAAILFPVFSRAREKSRQASCTSNQRQLVMAVLMAAQDHEETLPQQETVWTDINISPTTLRCPSTRASRNGYAYLGAVAGMNLNDFEDAAMTCVTAEGSPNAATGKYVAAYLEDLDTKRHLGNMTAGFLDGHVELVTPQDATLFLPERDFNGALLCFIAQALKDSHIAVSAQYTAVHPAVTFSSSYGASGALLSSLKASGKGDMYLPADDSYITQAGRLIRVSVPVAYQHPVLAVPFGNPQQLQGLADLLTRSGLRIAFADPNTVSISSFTMTALQQAGQWNAFTALLPTSGALAPSNLANVDKVAQAVQAGTADVGVVWDTTVKSATYRTTLTAIETSPLQSARAKIVIGVPRSSWHQYEALRYARYLADPDGGAPVLSANGFEPLK